MADEFIEQWYRVQINWAIDLFSLFLILAKKTTLTMIPLSEPDLDKLASSEEDPKKIAEQLNTIIDQINQDLKKTLKNQGKYLPFPEFSLISSSNEQSAVLDQIDMVERTLTEAAEAGVIDWVHESGYFSDLLEIFSQVELKKMKPQEGMIRLSGKLEKINEEILKNYSFPIPDISFYETSI